MHQQAPPVRDLVLVGGGHSHVQVLKSFGMKPLPGVRVTVVSRELNTPYSGMLPGFVAGFYPWRDIHIDLGPLANFAGARLISSEVVGLDLDEHRIKLLDRPDLRYDVLSINSGAVPVGVGDNVIPVKPIGRFLPQWEKVKRDARSGDQIVIVGGGAGGVELALAMRQALQTGVKISLITDRLLVGYNRRVVGYLSRVLVSRGVHLHVGASVEGVEGDVVHMSDGRSLPADYVFWVTGVQAPAWPREGGLATQIEGFIEVDRTLTSLSHPEVFATGDIAALVDQPRPKSGVFAVREGPVLSDNLRRRLTGRPLREFKAQKRFLSLIGTGDGRAVASKGPLSAWGRWAWRWKDRIDRKFMERFSTFPEMKVDAPLLAPVLQADAPDVMRCGGCGAKLGADPLRRVLARLPDQKFQHVQLGIGDDAAVLEHSNGNLVLTVDGFRSLVSDPYLFGRISAHHSLNDIFAMGARGTGALALATVPLMAESMMEEELYQLLKGVVDVLNAHDVPLVGGHSAEGAELSLGLTITGEVEQPMLTKAGLLPGDLLLLCKPLGTGVMFAANMRGRLTSDLLEVVVASMDRSNASALKVLRKHQVRGATDISGFGLLGHLAEMLRAGGVGVSIQLHDVPLLAGAMELMEAGNASSLQDNNERALGEFEFVGCSPGDTVVRLLVDPQTSGGLLAAVPSAEAEACLLELRSAGYDAAAIIGRVEEDGSQIITA